jgi:hypothetical protein
MALRQFMMRLDGWSAVAPLAGRVRVEEEAISLLT